MRQLEQQLGLKLFSPSEFGNACGTLVSEDVELPPQRPEDLGKLTVVLDIDETLLHTELVSHDGKLVVEGDAFTLSIQGLRLLVRKRPFLDSFLREASKRFELIAFTAGAEEYARPVLAQLDPEGTIFRHCLFRQHCVKQQEGMSFVKDLRVLNRSLRRTVLVDNNAQSFFMQLENGIPIASFFNDVNDTALVTLYHFLDSIDQVDDVRNVLNKVFGLGAAFASAARMNHMMTMQQA